MSNYDLSILIPARNEQFVAKTVEDLLEHKKGNTQIIVGLDGQWADPGIPDHKDVIIFYVPEAIGQRALTNQLCRLSKAKWVMKVDAHTAWDDGFDVKMLEGAEEAGDDATLVPVMRNLHAFDWVCPDGHRRYQGPSGPCKDCGKPTEKDIVWIAKPSPQSTAYRFDTTLHFQYHGEWKKQQDKTGSHLVETMSLQGSCFMLTREKYWELNICDESHGSWGQQGVEVACKTWLSGGKVLCNKKTWYAHLFRTQGGDFGFPYPLSGSEVQKARDYSKDLFINGGFKGKYDLKWLLDKFAPLPGWHDNQVDKDNKDAEIPMDNRKSIIYYTDNRLNLKIARTVQKQLRNIANEKGMLIHSSSLKHMSFGDKNTVINEKRGYLAYFKQIVAALESSTSEYVFFCEHDVLYHPSHFDFTPPTKDKFYYNLNVWRLRYPEDFAVTWEAPQVAELCCSRELALDFYRKRLAEYEADPEHFDRKFEPGGRDNNLKETWWSAEPNIDIRHGDNLTKSKWSINDFRDKSTCINWQEGKCPEWGKSILGI